MSTCRVCRLAPLRFSKPRAAELSVHKTIVPFAHPPILLRWSRVAIPSHSLPTRAISSDSPELKQIMFCFLDVAHTGYPVAIELLLTHTAFPEQLLRSLTPPAQPASVITNTEPSGVPAAADTSNVQPSISVHSGFPTEYLSSRLTLASSRMVALTILIQNCVIFVVFLDTQECSHP